jgi:dihydropteroate synthase
MKALNYSILSQGNLLDLSSPLVMGIINVNIDSFYKESRVGSIADAIQKAKIMVDQGAKILDIGAMSSRPGAEISVASKEVQILSPIVEALVSEFPSTWISIDTVHSSCAKAMLDLGAHIINDISAGTIDFDMIPTVASLKAPYIMMHMQGIPKTMQENPQYKDVTSDVIKFLADRVEIASQAGIVDIILDPGFGFGKTIEHNFSMLRDLNDFCMLDRPILCGLSRKSFIYKTLNTNAESAINGTTALHMIALQKGAKILRAHDVKEAIECITLYENLV